MRRRILTGLPLALILVAVACGGDDPAPAPGGASSSGGSIAGGTGGFVNSSGGASGTSGNNNTSSGNPGYPTPTDLVDTTEESMEHGGITRPYLLSKPKDYDANKKYPLVISFHGNPGTPKEQRELLPYDYASKNEAFVAYPAAGDGSDWNFSLPADNNGDFAFVKALIDEIASKANIDKDRVMGFGYSGGAYFLGQYACRVPGVLKMVAMLAGGAVEAAESDQKRPNGCAICPAAVPMFIAHGQNDESFGGGEFARICWSEQNGCTNSSMKTIDKNCKSYNGCDQGKPVTWCPVPDQGHEAWGGSLEASWKLFNSGI